MLLGRGDFLGNVLIKPEHNVVLQKNDVSVNGSHPSEKSTLYPYVKLPAELLILNRYGIGYAYLKAAWKLSQKYDIEAFEVLVKTKIISLKTWHHAQNMLAHERKVEIIKRKKKALLLSQSIHNLSESKCTSNFHDVFINILYSQHFTAWPLACKLQADFKSKKENHSNR